MPFPATAFAAEGAVFFLLAIVLIPRTAPTFRIATGLYLAVFVVSFALPSPIGGNIGRLGEALGIPSPSASCGPSAALRWRPPRYP